MENAPCSGEVVEFIRQTSCANMRVLSKIDVMFQLQNSDVISKSAGVELRVHKNTHDVALDVGVEFDVMIYIPFA